MSMYSVNDSSFQSKVRKQGATLVDFGASWCPPCKVLLPMMDELESEFGEQVTILKVDCDESPELAAAYGIMSMPTVMLLYNGEPVDKLVGLRPKSVYTSLLSRYVS